MLHELALAVLVLHELLQKGELSLGSRALGELTGRRCTKYLQMAMSRPSRSHLRYNGSFITCKPRPILLVRISFVASLSVFNVGTADI